MAGGGELRERETETERCLACERSRVWGGNKNRGKPHCCHGNTGKSNCAVNTTVFQSFPKPKPQDTKDRDSRARGMRITPREPAPIMSGHYPGPGVWSGQDHLPSFQRSTLPLEQREAPHAKCLHLQKAIKWCSLCTWNCGAVGSRRGVSHQVGTDGGTALPTHIP